MKTKYNVHSLANPTSTKMEESLEANNKILSKLRAELSAELRGILKCLTKNTEM